MAKSRFQLRGHCQRCGNQQAVMADGTMAHHGYTVKNGWFQGKCSGHQFQPVERSRATLDKTVEAIRASCVELLAKAAEIETGDVPAELPYYTIRVNPQTGLKERGTFMTPVQDIPSYRVADCLQSYVYSFRRRAEIGEAQALYMTSIADQFHGKDLIEVERK